MRLDLIGQYTPICGTDQDSFARFTIQQRLPLILHQIISDNTFNEGCIHSLERLKEQITDGKISDIISNGEDATSWNIYLAPYIGKSWLEVPFYFAEAYFYRLVLDKIDFFNDGIDPFFILKKADLINNQRQYSTIPAKFQQFKSQHPKKVDHIKCLLFNSLWGNKADLSQLHREIDLNDTFPEYFTLIDHSDEIVETFFDKITRVDIILDNCGLELFTDLMLVEELVSNHFVDHIVLHAKAYPMFVSDAMSVDIQYLINQLICHEKKEVSSFAEKLDNLLTAGKIQLSDHSFWNSPLHFYEMPEDLSRELQKSDLILLKGDANYRRIFGDRKIPVDTHPQMLANYLPAKSIAIRILKSEILLGLDKDIASSIRLKDKEWLINGKYGIIQKLN